MLPHDMLNIMQGRVVMMVFMGFFVIMVMAVVFVMVMVMVVVFVMIMVMAMFFLMIVVMMIMAFLFLTVYGHAHVSPRNPALYGRFLLIFHTRNPQRIQFLHKSIRIRQEFQ